MRLARPPIEVDTNRLPLWPPLLATRAAGSRSEGHAHHAMHLVLAVEGELRVRLEGQSRWQRAAGVLTAPDVEHSLDATGREVFLVFLDPESEVGLSLRQVMPAPLRLFSDEERAALLKGADPLALMRTGAEAWFGALVKQLGAPSLPARRVIHPRVRKLLQLLRTQPAEADTSLTSLAAQVGLSEGRLMHAFTESLGIPLRPYLSWLRLQRAAAGIVAGMPLTTVAAATGFADSGHMSRTFRRMLGMPPSALRPIRSRSQAS